jgi:SAM-dependent methyltransferase
VDPWAAVSGVYPSAMTLSGWHRTLRRFSQGFGGAVLDVGCGPARPARWIPGYVGVDATPSMLPRHGARVVCARSDHLPFPDDCFDIVMSAAFLGLLPSGKRADALREMARVCCGELHMLEPLAPLSRARQRLTLSRPIRVEEFAASGLQIRLVGQPLFAGMYTPVVVQPAMS